MDFFRNRQQLQNIYFSNDDAFFFLLRTFLSVIYHRQDLYRSMSNMVDVLQETGSAHPLRTPGFTAGVMVGASLLIIF